MSKTATRPVVVEANNHSFFLSKRDKLLVAVIAVVVLLGGIGGFFYYKFLHRVTYDDLESVQTNAAVSVHNAGGNVQAGLNVYNNAISNAADSKTRAGLYLQAAGLALSDNRYDTAIVYALKADAILHTPDSSALVALAYQLQGRRTEAVLYYRKAASEVVQNQLTGRGREYYLEQAQQAANGGSD